MVDQLERDVKPLFGHLNAIGSDASRVVALATARVERADKLFSDVAVRIDQTLNVVQASIDGPAREGRAMLAAFRAALQAIRELRNGRTRQGRGDDDDALFI
jgi:CHASE3 domain sensor protein